MKFTSSISRLAVAVGAVLAVSAAAHAQRTDAGTSVSNTFVLDYQVGGVQQGRITNETGHTPEGTYSGPTPVVQNSPTVFTVDRLIDLTVSADNAGLQVPPSAQDRQLTFTLTNRGNDNQSYSFVLFDRTTTTPGVADFRNTGTVITYSRAAADLNGDGDSTDGGCEDAQVDVEISPLALYDPSGPTGPLTADNSGAVDEYTCDIPPDVAVTITVTGDIPAALNEGDEDNFVLLGQTRDPLAWRLDATATTPGQVTANAAGTNTLASAAESVWADGQGTTEEEAGPDGTHSAATYFAIINADLLAEKTVNLVADRTDANDATNEAACAALSYPQSNDTAVFSLPGACVEYVISITNRGEDEDSDATGIRIFDQLPSDLKYLGHSVSGFETTPGPAPTVTAVKTGTATACDGAPGEVCDVELTGGILPATVGATDSEAFLYIRAIIR